MTETRFWGIRILCLVLSLVCAVSAVPPMAVTAEASAEVSVQTVDTCLIYRGASQRAGVIGRMENGTVLRVLDQRDDYYKIDCYDMIGYIAVSQVKQGQNGEYYIACQKESAHTIPMETQIVADALLLRAAILECAKGRLGKPYAYGATGPDAFDCSGFTSYVYRHSGYSLERVCGGQMRQGVIVSREGLQVGDLIFFGSSAGNVFHVGIYAGEGQVIHAGNRGIGFAELEGAWFAENYLCARRIIAVETQTMQMPSAAAESLLNNGGAALRTARESR